MRSYPVSTYLEVIRNLTAMLCLCQAVPCRTGFDAFLSFLLLLQYRLGPTACLFCVHRVLGRLGPWPATGEGPAPRLAKALPQSRTPPPSHTLGYHTGVGRTSLNSPSPSWSMAPAAADPSTPVPCTPDISPDQSSHPSRSGQADHHGVDCPMPKGV